VNLPLDERARLMARQGQAFATAMGARVVFPSSENDKNPVLCDVPRDGKTVGEIVTRGNIVMKEVGFDFQVIIERTPTFFFFSTFVMQMLHAKLSVVGSSTLET